MRKLLDAEKAPMSQIGHQHRSASRAFYIYRLSVRNKIAPRQTPTGAVVRHVNILDSGGASAPFCDFKGGLSHYGGAQSATKRRFDAAISALAGMSFPVDVGCGILPIAGRDQVVALHHFSQPKNCKIRGSISDVDEVPIHTLLF